MELSKKKRKKKEETKMSGSHYHQSEIETSLRGRSQDDFDIVNVDWITRGG